MGAAAALMGASVALVGAAIAPVGVLSQLNVGVAIAIQLYPSSSFLPYTYGRVVQ